MRLFSSSSLRALCLVLCGASIFSLFHADSAGRWLPVSLVIAAYLSFCLLIWQTHRQRQNQELRSSRQLHGSQIDGQVLIAYASQTGYAEQLARKTAEHLQQAGVSTQLCSLAQLDLMLLQKTSRLLLIASTTGEGDAPDQAAGFQRKVMSAQLSLPQLQYGILALGDRHYQHYCAFGHRLEHWLHHQQAHSMFDLVEVDNGDEGALRHWQHHLGIMSGHTGLSDWTTPGYHAWQLSERHLLNPGSLGGAVYHLVLTRHKDHSDDHCNEHVAWQAGDIAEIGPEYPPTENNEQTQGERPVLPHREYSISSISSDGQLELLVRQMRYPDGTLGIGSGWLTEYASTGQNIALRIRENRQFHTPQHDCPLILIGNGTGLAGLRAHLKQRITLGYRRNCLFFGERQRECDFFHQTEIALWQQQGFLPELHLCFSRDHSHDQSERRYVQHALQEQSGLLRQWVAEGAVIMVCGSLHGMADEVHTCLERLLGEDQLEQMAESGRYRRDVY
ncbi:sulfite reductase subunit alpha [Undibacterium sp. SXout7W]|uniref:sulfite reductase subunit alpha n=1 Tax=Undibacterium sp. SXout7W TaxID=3413049 RepID=UPI003BF03AA9